MRETPPGIVGMVNGWLSRAPAKVRARGINWRCSRRRRKTPASEAALDAGGSGLSLLGGAAFRVRLGLGEAGLQDFLTLVAQMRAQDMRQAGAVAAL